MLTIYQPSKKRSKTAKIINIEIIVSISSSNQVSLIWLQYCFYYRFQDMWAVKWSSRQWPFETLSLAW